MIGASVALFAIAIGEFIALARRLDMRRPSRSMVTKAGTPACSASVGIVDADAHAHHELPPLAIAEQVTRRKLGVVRDVLDAAPGKGEARIDHQLCSRIELYATELVLQGRTRRHRGAWCRRWRKPARRPRRFHRSRRAYRARCLVQCARRVAMDPLAAEFDLLRSPLRLALRPAPCLRAARAILQFSHPLLERLARRGGRTKARLESSTEATATAPCSKRTSLALEILLEAALRTLAPRATGLHRTHFFRAAARPEQRRPRLCRSASASRP